MNRSHRQAYTCNSVYITLYESKVVFKLDKVGHAASINIYVYTKASYTKQLMLCLTHKFDFLLLGSFLETYSNDSLEPSMIFLGSHWVTRKFILFIYVRVQIVHLSSSSKNERTFTNKNKSTMVQYLIHNYQTRTNTLIKLF